MKVIEKISKCDIDKTAEKTIVQLAAFIAYRESQRRPSLPLTVGGTDSRAVANRPPPR